MRTNAIILRVNNIKDPNAGNLNAAGWIELTIGNEKYTIISVASGVDYKDSLPAD